MTRLGVAERPICPACGLWSPPEQIERHSGICHDCWVDRNQQQAVGQVRIMTPAGTRHDDPRCPAVRQAHRWTLASAEEVVTRPKCSRCRWHPLFKIDHFTERDVRGIEQGVNG